MKRIKEHINLIGELEVISMTEFRERPGEVIDAVDLGKVFVLERNKKPIAVLSGLPGVNLAMEINENGNVSYSL